MISVSSLSSESSDKKFSLCVITDALMPVFIRLTVEKSLSAVQLVMGRAARACRRQFNWGLCRTPQQVMERPCPLWPFSSAAVQTLHVLHLPQWWKSVCWRAVLMSCHRKGLNKALINWVKEEGLPAIGHLQNTLPLRKSDLSPSLYGKSSLYGKQEVKNKNCFIFIGSVVRDSGKMSWKNPGWMC